MSTALMQFHFLRPWWLLLLLLWPPLLWQLSRVFGVREALTRLVDAALLPHLLERHSAHRRWPLALPPLAALLATLALAGPAWQRLPQPQYSRNAPQVIALSLSRHMLARDVTPDRLARARYKVHALLAANADGENGLIAYAGDAFVVAPLTTDAHALGSLLDSLSPDVMPVKGDAPERAIDRGVRLLHDGGAVGGALVLVTDTADAAAVDAARRALAAGVQVSVLGVGTTRGAPVTLPDGGFLRNAKGDITMVRRDDARLRAVAAAGGGRYQVMTDDGADVRALSAAEQRARRGGALALAQADRWRDFGPWLLLPLLPLAALAFRRGWLLALPLMLLPLWPLAGRAAPPPPAVQPRIAEVSPKAEQGAQPPAAGWRDLWWSLWLNADQRARRDLDDGHPRRAQQLARDPALRGAAAYRAGDFAAAAKAFAAASGSDAAYDRGNALVRQGHFEDGLKAYAQALKLDPENHDAAVNRKSVEDWLKKQQKQPLQGRPKPNGKNSQQGRNQRGGPGGNNQSDPHQAPESAPPKSPGGQQSRPAPQSPPAGGASSAPPSTPPPSPSSSSPVPPSSAPAPTNQPQSSRSPNPATARQQQNQAQNAGRALKSRMDQELDNKTSQPQPYSLGNTPASGSSSQELPRSMEQALQRVPDDPGGLLRRKFELEMQQRSGDQRGGSQ